MEKYCIINGFDNYAISNLGNIKNVKNGRILTPVLTPSGYLHYVFCQNGIKKGFMIHRLVAIYFINNPENKPCVNHKDGNKQNNTVNNLEWCTAKENDEHARKTGLKVQNKPIKAVNSITKECIIFNSIGEASGILGINKGNIYRALKHIDGCTHSHNYIFTYV